MKLTPMMQQYKSIKEQYPDAILFFRLGDFYEMFFDDALLASRILDIALTSRDSKNPVPMCGVPYHSADTYIAKLVSKGYKVAICEQVEDPKSAKGIVKREVVRIITPGTVMEGELLGDKENNYIAALFFENNCCGVSFADISTGEFCVFEIHSEKLFDLFSDGVFVNCLCDELQKLQPSELLIPESYKNAEFFKSDEFKSYCSAVLSCYEEGSAEQFFKYLKQQFSEDKIKNLSLPKNSAALKAAGALVKFLKDTQMRDLSHIKEIELYDAKQFMLLDAAARRNLEITKTIVSGEKKGSLLGVLDFCATAMGGRLIKKWIEQPLLDLNEINARLDAVQELSENMLLRVNIQKHLSGVYDLERLIAKVAYGTANARDLIALKKSLEVLPNIKNLLESSGSALLKQVSEEMPDLSGVAAVLNRALNENPPVSLKEGGLIKEGYNKEVDELRNISVNGRSWIAELEARERKRTGIKSLKVKFNKVFGYYIEVTKSNLNMVPDDYQRKQTLVNAERFITPELKKYEEMILNAQDKLVELEYQLFIEIREMVAKKAEDIQKSANAIAKLDVLVSFAEAAVRYNYARPVVNESRRILICDGRHPVVELSMEEGQFVPNDTDLDCDGHYIALITGPNMGGKSTYQRQVALITIMAQAGSFVPASRAEIGIVDRIYARVGASDDLAAGRSTFMVEMNECNNALRGATSRSLVIIDELGRGTSNLEGMAIAQAVIEYLHNVIKCRTLFSTHYHELAEMEVNLERLKNYAAAVEEKGDEVVFLHRIVPGKASKSYGVHCAKLAGLPKSVIDRAYELSISFEKCAKAARDVVCESALSGEQLDNAKKPAQVSMFDVAAVDEKNAENLNEVYCIINKIHDFNLLNMTPLEALNKLFEIQQEVRKLKNN